MFEFLHQSDTDAINILKTDHQKVKDLFDKFEKAEGAEKKKIVAEAVKELKIHTVIEEEIFYPALRAKVEEDILNEADEEHHLAKLLIAELDDMKGNEQHYDAKFTVLSECVRHHIREEESEMMPKARAIEVDFEALGQQLLARRQELEENGIPVSEEEQLMRGMSGKDDSPARAARTAKRPAGRKVAATRGKLTVVRKASRAKPVVKKAVAKRHAKLHARPAKAGKRAVTARGGKRGTAGRKSAR